MSRSLRHVLVSVCAIVPLGEAAWSQSLPPIPVPPGNPITLDKANLGKVLFWEEQLSSSRTISCGTCHIPTAGGSDPRTQGPGAVHPGSDEIFGTSDDVFGSPGVVQRRADGTFERSPAFGLRPQVTGRKSPSMINAVYSPLLFWDGRATNDFSDPITGAPLLPNRASLESQAAGPPLSTAEMGHLGRDWTDVVTRVQNIEPLAVAASVPTELETWIAGRSYDQLFTAAFNSPGITAARIAMAIATYERTLISDQTPFDDFLRGVPGALTPQQERGRQIFNGRGNCNECHSGPLLTDQQFHNIGVRPPAEDQGRFEVTGLPQDRGRFKTPGLRNVSLRGPFFHNGRTQTLADVVAFYNRGGDFAINLDPEIRPLGLSLQERTDLIAFLSTALLDQRVANGTAPFDRPTLYSESLLQPASFGAPTAGTGGIQPEMVALEPALVGNPEWTVGVDRGHPGAPALLGVGLFGIPSGFVVFGARVYLSPSTLLPFLSTAPLEGTQPGEGFGSASVALPTDPSLAGTTVFLQWVIVDPGSSGGLAASAASNVTFF